jgi:type I restriction enzyme S subunit
LKIDSDEAKRISPSISSQYSRTILEGGEVLVNVRGTLGGVAVVPPSMKGWNISREVAVVPVDNRIANPSFLALALASQESQRWLSSVEKGVAYVGINIEDLRALPIKLPSPIEQTEIVCRVESLFAYADQIEARVQEATARVNHLTQSSLAKAFRGELTADWRAAHPELVTGQNSAETLLERIRTERVEVPTVKGKRGRKS